MNIQWYSKQYPVYRDTCQLMLEIETAVRHFPRYHKYTLGSELRQLANQLMVVIAHAINKKNQRVQWVTKASNLSEELKIKIQCAKDRPASNAKPCSQSTNNHKFAFLL